MGSGPTSLALLSRGAGCLSGVSFYLLSRLDGQNWIYCSTLILGLIRSVRVFTGSDLITGSDRIGPDRARNWLFSSF